VKLDDAAVVSVFGEDNRWVKLFRRSAVVRQIALLAAWLLLWELGWLVEYIDHASVWFPVAGMSFAALMVIGPGALPALAVGCVLITFADAYHYQLALSHAQVLQAGVLFAVAHLVPYGLAAAFLRREVRRGKWDLSRLIVQFLVIAAAAAALAMVLVLSSLLYTHMMQRSELPNAWLPFWVGDMAGVLALAPLFVGVLSILLPGALFEPSQLPGFPFQRPTRRFAEKLAFTEFLLAASMLLARLTHSPNSAFAIFFLVIPHMWIASSESPLMNALSVAISSFVIASLAHWFHLMDFVMVYQFAICVIAANTLFGLAIPTLLAHNVKLRTAAFTDTLTQVASRDRVEQRAALEILRSGLERRALSLLVFDLDRFKEINDTHGHLVGDQALQRACEVVQQSLRPSDILGRIGGDEFVVLLPNTTLAAADQIAARVIEQLRGVRVARTHALTASFGLAEWQSGERYESLFMRADRALYQAKLEGRNRVVAERLGAG
jgi:diguanylate cyclase (GGDEF)-like protein